MRSAQEDKFKVSKLEIDINNVPGGDYYLLSNKSKTYLVAKLESENEYYYDLTSKIDSIERIVNITKFEVDYTGSAAFSLEDTSLDDLKFGNIECCDDDRDFFAIENSITAHEETLRTSHSAFQSSSLAPTAAPRPPVARPRAEHPVAAQRNRKKPPVTTPRARVPQTGWTLDLPSEGSPTVTRDAPTPAQRRAHPETRKTRVAPPTAAQRNPDKTRKNNWEYVPPRGSLGSQGQGNTLPDSTVPKKSSLSRDGNAKANRNGRGVSWKSDNELRDMKTIPSREDIKKQEELQVIAERMRRRIDQQKTLTAKSNSSRQKAWPTDTSGVASSTPANMSPAASYQFETESIWGTHRAPPTAGSRPVIEESIWGTHGAPPPLKSKPLARPPHRPTSTNKTLSPPLPAGSRRAPPPLPTGSHRPAILATNSWTTAASAPLDAATVTNALRLLMKADREERKLSIRQSKVKINSWRENAYRALGVNPDSPNLFKEISDKISHLSQGDIRTEIQRHYEQVNHNLTSSGLNSRISQIIALFEMIKGQDKEVVTHQGVKDNIKAEKAYDGIDRKHEKIAKNYFNFGRRSGRNRNATSSVVEEFSRELSGEESIETDTVEDFQGRLAAHPDIMVTTEYLTKQSQSALRRKVADQSNHGGRAFNDWLDNKGLTRDHLSHMVSEISSNPSILNQESGNPTLTEIFNHLSEMVGYCIDNRYLTEKDSAISNVMNAFRGYCQGLNLSLSNNLCEKFIRHAISKRSVSSDLKFVLQSCLPLLNEELGKSDIGIIASKKPRRQPNGQLPGAISDEKDTSRYPALDKLIQFFEKSGVRHVFFDLDDTLIKHTIANRTDPTIIEKIFGEGTGQFTSSTDGRSYAHISRQGFYHDNVKRNMIKDLVADPEMTSYFMNNLKARGMNIHISTLNSSTLAKVLCETRNWPVSSISAADGQIADYQGKGGENILNESIKTEASHSSSLARKIAATEAIVGGRENLRHVAFFDDDFSRASSATCYYLEENGAHCLMKGRAEGVRFDSKHRNFEEEIESFLEEKSKPTPALSPSVSGGSPASRDRSGILPNQQP